jgi:glycerophosphoryl diester phosphodiesterase
LSLPAPLAARLAAGGWLRTAHRGAPYIAPGNSRAAILVALGCGIDLVEVDVHATHDGRLVLWHDDDLHGTRIANATIAELRALDLGDGSRILELGEAMELAQGRAGLMIDLKADGLGAAVGREVRAHRFAPAVVCGHYRESMREVQRIAPETGTSLTLDWAWRLKHGIRRATAIDADAVTVRHTLLTARLFDELRSAGLVVLAWTVDDPRRMRQLLARGVNGITSNRPELFASLTEVAYAPALPA